MKKPQTREKTKFWHAPDIGNLELLKATYVTHTFRRHTHNGYVIGVIEEGIEGFYYRGRMHAAMPGDIVIINPEEVHTGHSVDHKGWTYRMMYPDANLLKKAASDLTGASEDYPFFRKRLSVIRSWQHTYTTSIPPLKFQIQAFKETYCSPVPWPF